MTEQTEVKLISEQWCYRSIFGNGTDYGLRACVYCHIKKQAFLVITRHRMTGTQNENLEQVMEKREMDFSDSLEEQIGKFISTRNEQPNTSALDKQPGIFMSIKKGLGYGYSYSDIKVSVLQEPRDIQDLLQDNKKLFKWLYEKTNQGEIKDDK